ncbi:hypothetical protein EVAR_39486_1 [Eumeta japonica]|uniref:Uncharacterized protein n=1 Tax=Eumeta variegata TaxID=151549 RepID=A0A4C1W2Y8_EUMVA|nr:hypothetical protein EVAR_39486_1 [Eumeta japonica]
MDTGNPERVTSPLSALLGRNRISLIARGLMEGKWGDEEEADHRNPHSLDEMQQRKLLLYFCTLYTTVVPLAKTSTIRESKTEPTFDLGSLTVPRSKANSELRSGQTPQRGRDADAQHTSAAGGARPGNDRRETPTIDVNKAGRGRRGESGAKMVCGGTRGHYTRSCPGMCLLKHLSGNIGRRGRAQYVPQTRRYAPALTTCRESRPRKLH